VHRSPPSKIYCIYEDGSKVVSWRIKDRDGVCVRGGGGKGLLRLLGDREDGGQP
jgi:hypothetical protein